MRIHLLLTSGLVLCAILLLAIAGSGGPAAALGPCERHVVGVGGVDAGDCSDGAQPCKTVQYAINHAVTGDRICVADRSDLPGPTVYEEQLFVNDSIVLDGKWQATCAATHFECSLVPVDCNPENVVLDAKGLGRVISIAGFVKPVIDCFTITGGTADGLGGDPDGPDAGGGIYSRDAAPIITNNIITGNYGCDACPVNYGHGGGIYLLNAPATSEIQGNLVAGNVAANMTLGWGGGIMLRQSDTQVWSNKIRDNLGGIVGDGGGMMVLGGSAVIAKNEISYNWAGTAVLCNGGGIFVRSDKPVTIEGNLLEYNQAIHNAGDPTLISRGGGIYYTGDPTGVATIRDNVVRHNIASPISPAGYGGGIYVSGLVPPSVVSGNHLEWNIAGHNDDGNGGGLYVDDSEVTISGNDIFDNSATWAGGHGEGGGLYINEGTVLVQSNVITRNHGAGFEGFPSTATGYGGGIAISNSLTLIEDNWIVGNHGTNADEFGAGGGIYGFRGSLQIVDNTIAENRATPGGPGFGGGLYLEEMSVTLEANTILDNVAAKAGRGRGGGVRITWSPAFTLTNNIVARNSASELASGAGIAANSKGVMAHNTIAENWDGDGSGVHVSLNSDVILYSNIVVSHTVGITNADVAGSNVDAKFTLFEGNLNDYGAGVSSSDEVAGPAALLADYHLGASSGAIDQAPVLSWVTRDIDGDARPMGVAPDVGADERWVHISLPLILRAGP